jgi:mannose/fructose/N-acetylgalactosamine-specific phosphotransferase system component IID
MKQNKHDIYLAVGIAGVAVALLTVFSFFYRKLDAIAIILAVIVTGILGVLFSIRRP